jgi:hypothetical protein
MHAKPAATPGFVKHYRKYVASVYDAVDVDDALHKLAQEPFYGTISVSCFQNGEGSISVHSCPDCLRCA